MQTINGIYTSAIIFTTNNHTNAMDDYALQQLQMLTNNETSKGCKIRVMPDVHPGKVGTIGLTMTVGTKLMPNLVGIDVGCGMSLTQIKGKKVEFQKLDTIIRDHIPSGFAIRTTPHRFSSSFDFTQLHCYKKIQEKKATLSLGTLGGGNHFIEIDKDHDDNLYLIVHSGSRHLGKEVTEYYLKEGQNRLKENGIQIPYELTYLEGSLLDHYLHDIQILCDFAALNREIIVEELVKAMKWKVVDTYSCIHNYVDFSTTPPILRKGAISAKLNEKVVIPINMRDGIILGFGLGNEDWNYSAPHGAGRIMPREQVKSNFTLSAFKTAMKGIYSSCIGKDTLDESPFAYRSLDDVSEALTETVTINKIIRPIYNYKSGGN